MQPKLTINDFLYVCLPFRKLLQGFSFYIHKAEIFGVDFY